MKKNLLFLILVAALLLVGKLDLRAQGCVAVRNMTSSSFSYDTTGMVSPWQFSLNYRYFHSFRHFRGTEEETNRVDEGTNVINNDNSILVGITYSPNNRWTFGLTLPYLNIDRSSLYEHYGNRPGNQRFHTQAAGIGDMRLAAYYAVRQNHRMNLTVGLGVKRPTGNYNTKDYFHKLSSEGEDSLVYKPVDQSIQLGDGGFGVIVEFDASYMFSRDFSLYATGLYLSNPRNTNGIERSSNLSGGIPLSNEFSVVDQFLTRLGVRYSVNAFQFALGGRFEGIPSEDLIGKSDGFRRPGYIISIEPAIGYIVGKHSFGVSLPIALERNRTQNTVDKIRTEQTGSHVQGDAAFADWLLSVSYAYRL
jgi:hypothetical protein